MIVLPMVLQQLQRMDERRSGVPGEHWATFGAGLALLRMAGPRRAPWVRVAAGVGGVALIWRAVSGRDGFLRQVSQLGKPAPADGQPADTAAPALPAPASSATAGNPPRSTG